MSATIRQKIQALKLARNRIESGQEEHICYALAWVGYIHWHLRPAVGSLRKYVRRALGKHATLGTWLDEHLKGRPDLYCYERTKATRLAWIDWMIQCYEEDLAKQKGT